MEEQLQKIINFTSKFASPLGFDGLSTFKVPGSSLTALLTGDEGDLDISSLSDIKDIVSDVGGLLATGTNIIKCIGTMHEVDGWSNLLGSLAMGVTGVIAAIADEIWNAIAAQLNMAVQQVIGTLFNIVTAIHNLVKSGFLVYQAIKNIFSGNFSFSDLWEGLNWNTFLAKENCADMFAAIAGCFLNKFLGPYIDEFKEKATSKINELGKSMNDLIYDELADANLYAAYANREAFLLEKMSHQINGYNDLLKSGISSLQ